MDLGLLQREAGAELGVTASTINNWERNRTRPALRCVPRVIEFLGYNPLETAAESLGQRVTAYRRSRGLSRETVAAYLGVNESTLWRWESDQSVPSEDRRRRLETRFGDQVVGLVSPIRLLGTRRVTKSRDC